MNYNIYMYSMNINISILFCCFPTGYQVVVAVQFCSCKPDFLRLLGFNLWDTTPTRLLNAKWL